MAEDLGLHPLWLVCVCVCVCMCEKVTQAFSISKALNGYIENCLHSHKEHTICKQSCQTALTYAEVFYPKKVAVWAGYLEIQTPLAERTAIKVCSTTMEGS